MPRVRLSSSNFGSRVKNEKCFTTHCVRTNPVHALDTPSAWMRSTWETSLFLPWYDTVPEGLRPPRTKSLRLSQQKPHPRSLGPRSQVKFP